MKTQRFHITEENIITAEILKLCNKGVLEETTHCIGEFIFKLAGIDTSRFGAHSTRAASSSAAKKAGVPIMDVLSTGGWSSERVFARHYSVPIQNKGNFAEAISKS